LVALAPDVIVAIGGTSVEALQQVTRAVPIVFVQVTDPVSRGSCATPANSRELARWPPSSRRCRHSGSSSLL
jgi:hypothetical protein